MIESDHTETNRPLRRLLLVLSNQNFLSTLRRILTRCGYTVDGATSGEEALQQLGTRFYDAIISDVHLPGQVCGITLMHQMRTAGRKVPIIFLTERETSRIREALESCQGAESLPLPLDVDRLKQLVASRCGN